MQKFHFLITVLFLLISASAQGPLSELKRVNGENTRQAFSKIIDYTFDSLVRLIDEDNFIASGIIISSDGLILAKASEIERAPRIKLPDGSIYDSLIVAKDEATDLLLLKINCTGLIALEIPEVNPDVETADWVISPLPGNESKIGIVSAAKREIIRISGVIGVLLGDSSEKGVIVNQAVSGGPAYAAGVRSGDLIQSINTTSITTRNEVLKALKGLGPGQKINVTFNREGKSFSKDLILGDRNITFGMFNRNLEMSGSISKRADGFKEVIQHDIPLKHFEMLSPLFNIEGKLIGINIAKANRTEFFTLPNTIVNQAIGRLKVTPIPVDNLSSKSSTVSLEELLDVQKKIKGLLKQSQEATVGLQVQGASGSGIIISNEGIIATAAHISGDPGTYTKIHLHDGRVLDGESLGKHVKGDIGLIKINSNEKLNMPYVKVGESNILAKGSWCFALGHPNGFDPDRGSVLRIGKVIDVRPHFIWTDCTLLGGDSGGPLFNIRGELIGIHSRIFDSADENLHGPTDLLTKNRDALIEGKVIREGKEKPFLGVGTDSEGIGIKVTEVVKNSAADRAGILKGDIILSIDQAPIINTAELIENLKDKKIGQEVMINLTRNGNELQLKAVLGAKP